MLTNRLTSIADDSFASAMLLTGHLIKTRSILHLERRRARSILLGDLRNGLSRPLTVRAVFSWLGHDHRAGLDLQTPRQQLIPPDQVSLATCPSESRLVFIVGPQSRCTWRVRHASIWQPTQEDYLQARFLGTLLFRESILDTQK